MGRDVVVGWRCCCWVEVLMGGDAVGEWRC